MNGTSRAVSKLSTTPSLLTPSQCISLVQTYARTRSLPEGKQLHSRIVSSGILHSSNPTHLLPTKLASMYALSGDMHYARLLFDQISLKSCFLWNSLIRGYSHIGQSGNALHLFEEMISSGSQPDKFTFTFALKACADLSLRQEGMEIHCRALTTGSGSDGYVQNSLVAMYMSCGSKEKAGMVFDRMREKTIVSWNTMISGLFQNGCAEEALMVFDQMLESGVEPDCATVVSLLPACAQLKDLQRGRRVHELVEVKGFGHHLPVTNSLIDMYVKCNNMNEAWRLFGDEMSQRDVISWTSMIGGCVLNGYAREALALSHQMMISGIRPNAMAMAGLLAACSSIPSLRHSKCAHGSCLRLSLESEIIVETALIDMYAKCGNMDFSSLAFAKSSRRPATWNAVISGYARNGQAREAIEQFKLMQVETVHADLATIASVLPAYSSLVDLQQARNIHSHLIKTGFHLRIEVTTSLIDLYSKTGSLDIARELFDGLSKKDIVSWSSIIAGYGAHGHARTAILLFNQMVESGEKPNEVTFTSILHSCSHAGLVDEGLSFFSSMIEDHHMKPKADHYACIVDLLGRAGRLNEAHGLISAMSIEPNHAVWGALLGACVIHGNVELGEEAGKHLFELEPENTGNYVLLGNLYAAMGRWEDVESVRSLVKERGLKKEPGCSLSSMGTSYHMTSWMEPMVLTEESEHIMET